MTPAWMLPARHPDLCPGSHKPCAHSPIAVPACPACGLPHATYHAPTTPGGGRLVAHYRPNLLDLEPDGG